MKKIINVWFLVILISVELTASVYFVSPTGNNGVATSWATAKTTIQGAINFATSGDVIIVKYGSYTISTQITVGNKNLKIISDIGTATSWETATPDSSQCILTGSNSRIFYFDDSAITSACVIKGFKITNGNASAYATNGLRGGGILIKNGADPTIENCWITANYACTAMNGALGALGGGIFIQDSSPIIQYNLISANIATNKENTGSGGGIYAEKASTSSAPIIRYNTITGNYATTYAKSTSAISFANLGGGLCLSRTAGEITGNVFKDNICAYRETYSSTTYTSLGLGGAIAIDDATTTILNNIFVGNQALNDPNKYGIGGNPTGGAIYITLSGNYTGSLTVINNTFYNNKLRNSTYYDYGTQKGQAIYLGEDGSGITASIQNNIFSSHSISYGDGRAIYSSNSKTVSYNNFNSNASANYNITSNNEITSDPLFVNAAGNDFTLQSSSPCINAGDPTTSVPTGGEPIIDLGFNEYVNTSSSTNNSVDNSFSGNFVNGKSFSIQAESGTVNCTSQLYLSSPPNNSSNKRNIGRYWDISATGNSKIRLYYPSSSKTGFTGSPTIYHYNGTSWEAISTNVEQSEGASYYVESTNPISSWSYFTVGDSNDPLPIELTSFSVVVINSGIKLTWQTATEINNYGFSVQRRMNNEDWKEIVFVNGHGNSNSPKTYTHTDTTPLFGKIEYRLKQIDFDGAFEFSAKTEVIIETPTNTVLEQNYPNPYNPETTIKYRLAKEGYVSLRIYDMLGNHVFKLVEGYQQSGIYKVNINAVNLSLSSGMYIYQLTIGGVVLNKKMVLVK